MENLKINGTTSVQQTSSTSKKEETKATTPEMKKDGNKKLKLALAGLAVTGAVITAGVMIYKGHSKKVIEAAKEELGNFDKRLAKIRKGYDFESLKEESQEMIEAFKGLKKETISSLDDSFIRRMLVGGDSDENAKIAKVIKSVLEEDFTPDELSKIIKNPDYEPFMRKYIKCKAFGTNKPDDMNVILNHLHEVCKNS